MTLQSSGAISIANINTELGVASTTTLSLNDSAARTLAGVASGPISMSNFYGKSNAPAVTFTPNGGSSSGSPVALSNYGYDVKVAVVTITCSASASWTWTRGTYSGASTVVVGGVSKSNISGTASGTSIKFTVALGTGPRYTNWTVSGTSGGVTKYYTVYCSTDGIGAVMTL